jgi:hypothetical protein
MQLLGDLLLHALDRVTQTSRPPQIASDSLRTSRLQFTKLALYQLSYRGIQCLSIFKVLVKT